MASTARQTKRQPAPVIKIDPVEKQLLAVKGGADLARDFVAISPDARKIICNLAKWFATLEKRTS